jgi:hypothetical protein
VTDGFQDLKCWRQIRILLCTMVSLFYTLVIFQIGTNICSHTKPCDSTNNNSADSSGSGRLHLAPTLQLSRYGPKSGTTPHATLLCLAITLSVLVEKSKLI